MLTQSRRDFAEHVVLVSRGSFRSQDNMSHKEANERAWDRLSRANSVFARVANDSECAQPLKTLDARGWLPSSVQGLDVLCLAAGGGWQSILYAVAGARVTVVDLSGEMLSRDEQQAQMRGVHVTAVQTSMEDLAAFANHRFDIVHQPVSTCYVPNVQQVFREVARVLRPNGLYISQHKQPTSLQIAARDSRDRYIIGIPYYHSGPLPAVQDDSYREAGTVEYLHRWEDLVGGMCRAGLRIEDLVEPRRGDPQARPGQFQHRGMFTPPYVRIKARKLEEQTSSEPVLWTPGVQD